jgi:hypothetical protein
MSDRRVYIGEVADIVNRRVDTLRKLDTRREFPAHLRPRKGERGWRYWNESQLDDLIAWFGTRYPGSALAGYDPTPERLEQHIERMRHPRQSRRST